MRALPAPAPAALARIPLARPTWIGAALCLVAVLAVVLVHEREALMTEAFSDTDDILRLVSVRDLLAGAPWYERHVARLQPPLGLELHWSRLVDGGIAGLIALTTPVLGESRAITAVRTIWPLMWTVPALASVLAIAMRLGGVAAMVGCGLAAAALPILFVQFAPGRIDHHGIQVALALAALAGVVHMDRRAAAGWVAGGATGLGLAVGLEAIAFAALAGGAVALRLAFEPALAPATRRYAAALAATSLAAYLAQTPPAWWAATACDSLAANLLAGVLVAAGGLLLACRAIERGLARPARPWLVAGVGLAAAVACLALDPGCLRGPFADVEPDIRRLWLDHVREVQPIWVTWARKPLAVAVAIVPLVVALATLPAILSVRAVRRDPAWLAVSAALAVAAALALLETGKGIAYATWLSVPFASAAVARRDRPAAPAALAGLVLAAAFAGWSARAELAAGAGPESPFRACTTPQALAALARAEPGLVVNEIDMGPGILAFTPHAALSAPYHRMPHGIRTASAILSSPPDEARARMRAIGAGYVVTCGTNAPAGLPHAPGGLAEALARGAVPPWLEALGGGEPLRAYRLRAEAAPQAVR